MELIIIVQLYHSWTTLKFNIIARYPYTTVIQVSLTLCASNATVIADATIFSSHDVNYKLYVQFSVNTDDAVYSCKTVTSEPILVDCLPLYNIGHNTFTAVGNATILTGNSAYYTSLSLAYNVSIFQNLLVINESCPNEPLPYIGLVTYYLAANEFYIPRKSLVTLYIESDSAYWASYGDEYCQNQGAVYYFTDNMAIMHNITIDYYMSIYLYQTTNDPGPIYIYAIVMPTPAPTPAPTPPAPTPPPPITSKWWFWLSVIGGPVGFVSYLIMGAIGGYILCWTVRYKYEKLEDPPVQ